MNGPFGALAVVVERVGDQLLAGAVLALDQDVGVAAGDALDQLEHLVHLLALADDVAEAELVLDLLLEQQVLAEQVAPLDGPLEHREQRVGVDRLLDEARSAPAFIASTAFGTLPWPVTTMTSVSACVCLKRRSSSSPSMSGSIMSVTTTSGFQVLKISSPRVPIIAVRTS